MSIKLKNGPVSDRGTNAAPNDIMATVEESLITLLIDG